MSMRLIDEVSEFAAARLWILVEKPYGDDMGFLPCDALGPNVYCVYDGDVPIGHSQMGYEEALEQAVFRTERWQRERIKELEKDRDSWKREVDACHAIMAKVREIWGADTLTVDAAQGVQDRISELNAEQSVMDDTLDMVGAPQCGDPFMPERITRVQMLGDKIEKQSSELDACWDVIGSQFGSMAGAMVASSEKRLKAKQDTV